MEMRFKHLYREIKVKAAIITLSVIGSLGYIFLFWILPISVDGLGFALIVNVALICVVLVIWAICVLSDTYECF
jgi:hypothetical protein